MLNKIIVDKSPRKGVEGHDGRVYTGVVMLVLFVLGVVSTGAAQQRPGGGRKGAVAGYFQGGCGYRVSVRSKVADLSDKDIHKVLTVGDLLTVTIKDGNYKFSTEYADTYIIKDDRKEYIKFRKIDTVFYLEFDSDTDRVTGIV